MEQAAGITTTTTVSTASTSVTGVQILERSVYAQAIPSEEQNLSLSAGIASSSGGGISTGGTLGFAGLASIGASSGGPLSESQRSISAAPSATPSPVLSPPGKIFGRNANGTMVATSTPSNEAELQLYRVLQRASLLAYYDTLLEMGGDDVQQLCDAGEEEFLEIMALVGMASKPLHVRRLQKALHEWANNPSLFQAPLPSSGIPESTPLLYTTPEPSTSRVKFTVSPSFTPTPLMSTASTVVTPHTSSSSSAFSPLTAGVTSHQVTSSSPQLTPVLTEAQIARIALIAEKMVRQIPQKEPRQLSSKKRTSRELEQVMAMSENDPRRMDEIRKYAAIYGRFDCKRRPEKPLTLHEVCVNEAAAQICKFIPALLTRRDELFPLARQLVKDAGFGHSASIARFLGQQQPKQDETDSAAKRTRLSSTETLTSEYTKEYLEDTRINLFAMYQKLAKPPFDLSDISKFSLSRSDYDEDNDNDNDNDDSRFSFSTSSSPPFQLGSEADIINRELNENGRRDVIPHSPNHHHDSISNLPTSPIIISAAGGHIIAVANPALAMSPALNETLNIKRETTTPDI